MKTRFGSKSLVSLGLITIGVLLFAGCGPLTPSASKIAGKASEKNLPTNGSPNSDFLSIGTEKVGLSPEQPAVPKTVALTEVMTAAEFAQWEADRKAQLPVAARMRIDNRTVHKLGEALGTGPQEFTSQADGVKDREATLMGNGFTKRVILVLNMDRRALERAKLDKVRLSLRFSPGTQGSADSWEIALDETPIIDPVIEGNDPAEDLRTEQAIEKNRALRERRAKLHDELAANLRFIEVSFEVR